MKEKDVRRFFLQPFVLVVIFLEIVFLITAYLFCDWKNPMMTEVKYKLINPTTSLISKEAAMADFSDVSENIQKKYGKMDDYLVSIYFEYFPTGANFSVNKDEKIWPASLIKIPVAMAMMKKVESGKWKLDNELVILDEDKDGSFGTLYQQPSGTSMKIEDLLKKSLAESDNTAHFVLLRNLDGAEIEDVYNHLGLDDIVNDIKKSSKSEEADNRMTAKKYSVFFRSLYNATYLNSEYSEIFLNFLSGAKKEYLSDGLPDNIQFIHKTDIRTDDNVRADSGIVYVPERHYMLTVMLQKKTPGEIDEKETNAIFTDLSKEIYTYVSKKN